MRLPLLVNVGVAPPLNGVPVTDTWPAVAPPVRSTPTPRTVVDGAEPFFTLTWLAAPSTKLISPPVIFRTDPAEMSARKPLVVLLTLILLALLSESRSPTTLRRLPPASLNSDPFVTLMMLPSSAITGPTLVSFAWFTRFRPSAAVVSVLDD